MPKTLPLPIVAGGRLLTQPSVGLETAGAENFSRLLNVFRDFDVMARMPGWIKFQPDTGQPVANQYTYDGSENLLKLAELVRGDGTRVIVAASLTKIKYYDTATDAWVQIGSGFSASGEPWQAIPIANYLILNNAVNLPVWWEIGDAAVTPLHELREAGIASVGRISIYNGFLFVGDIVEIRGDQLAPWMNGYANHTTTSTQAENANFTILDSEHRVQFNVTTGASTITATLPAMTLGSVPFYCWLTKVDAGAGTVVTSPVVEDEAVILDSQNDSALLWWNGTRWAAVVFPSGSIPSHDPYGMVYDAIKQYIPDEQAWSDLGNPINFAPLVKAVQESSSTSVILPFKPNNWIAGQTRVAVVNGGPDGGTLGGQSTSPVGILISAIAAFAPATMGVTITLETATDSSISYPRQVSVTRWTDISTFVGKQRLGNGSRILNMVELNGIQIVYHATGAFLNRWTAQKQKPFALRDKYSGQAIPRHGDCIASVRNAYHLYPSVEGSFIRFDGLSDPVIHEMCEGARDLFFDGLGSTDRIWAIDNPTLQTIWFVRPTKVMAYRYRKDSEGVSEIDAAIVAAVFARKPGGTVDWFVLGQTRFVYQWGLVSNTISTWLRDGTAPDVPARLTSGLNSFRNQLNEKVLHSVTPILSSTSPDVELEVQLRSTYNPSGTLTDLLDPIESLPGPAGENFVGCFFQATYFQDEITLVDDRDIDFRLSARIFEFDVIGGLPVTRTSNG